MKVQEPLQKAVLTHQRDWDEKLPIFLLASRASIHETIDTTATGMVFQRELCLPHDLLFAAPPPSPDKEQCTNDYVVDLMDRLHDIHY
jgi:hypothetical protein